MTKPRAKRETPPTPDPDDRVRRFINEIARLIAREHLRRHRQAHDPKRQNDAPQQKETSRDVD